MNTSEAVEICNRWLTYLDDQRKKTLKMQELATQARLGPMSAKMAQAELRRMDRQPRVYDGDRLRPAVEHLLATVALPEGKDEWHWLIRNATPGDIQTEGDL